MITTKVSLQLVDQTVPAIIPVVQGDTGRSIIFEPSDFTIPEGATATYYIQKPSGEAVYNSAEITGNTVVCNLTAQSIIETGENTMQVRIILGEDIVTSFDAILMVRPFRGIGAVESKTEINIFDKAVEEAEQEISDKADEIIAEKVPELEAIVEEVIESIPADYTALTNNVSAMLADMATEFSAEATYQPGDIVIYGNDLYRKKNGPNITGEWIAAQWEAITLGSAIEQIVGNLAPQYDQTATYHKDDAVIYLGDLYICTSTLSVTGTWDASKWSKTDVSSLAPAVDATLTQQGKPADAKAVGDEIADVKADFNEFQYGQTITNSDDTVGYINTSGSLVVNSSWHCIYTQKLKCAPGDKYSYSGGTYTDVCYGVLYFKGTSAVSHVSYRNGSRIVTVPDDVDGVIFQSASVTADTVTLSVEKISPMSFEQLVDYCEGQNDKIAEKVDYSDGIVISDDTPGRMTSARALTDTSAWHCLYTNVLNVKPGWKFLYIGGTYAQNKAHCVYFYKDGTFVSSAYYNIGVEAEVTIPDNVNQVWFQMATAKGYPVAMTVKRLYPVAFDSVLSDFDNVSDYLYGLQDGTLLPKYKVLDGEDYGYIGRWYDYTYDGDSVKVASAAGAEVCFKVSGTTSITINWTGANVSEHVYYCYYIDNGTKVRCDITDNTITLPDTGEHIVRIVCDSIPHSDSTNCWTVGYGWVFGGVDANGGTLKGIVPTNKTVMYFGDSLTEGVRAYGAESGSQVEADVDSATESYGFYASKYLGCASVIVGYGSTGLTANGYFKKCIDALNNLANGIPTEDVSPDLIVINHGHNDTGANSQTWISAFDTVVNRIMTKYPGVKVVALSPFNRTHASDMQTACEDKPHCHYVDTVSWGLSNYYADGPGHLTAAGAEVCGRKLAKAILNLNLM